MSKKKELFKIMQKKSPFCVSSLEHKAKSHNSRHHQVFFYKIENVDFFSFYYLSAKNNTFNNTCFFFQK